MTFQEQYKHPEWQKKRLEVLEANGFQCQSCDAVDQELHVHHPIYKKKAKLWEYKVEELRCLCHGCHEAEHIIIDCMKVVMSNLTLDQKSQVLGYADGLTSNVFHAVGPKYRRGLMDALRGDDERLSLLIPSSGQ